MFKRTRLKIFLLIMVIATVVITLMLSVIYIVNSRSSYERSISLLENYMENDKNPPPDAGTDSERPELPPKSKDDHKVMFKLSTFYSVVYSESGDVIKVDYGDGTLYSEQEVLEMAENVILTGKNKGVYSKMPFLIKDFDETKMVAFIDNTMEVDNSGRLFEISLIVGSCAWGIIMIIAWYLSKNIVRPLEENDIKQKQFISDAGHELKTPISVISANADILSLEIGENKWLSNIQYENERMGNLVMQLLELVRAENVIQTKEELDLSRLVSGGALTFESVAYENGLILNSDIEDNITVDGNQSQLSQLVSILIDNAIDNANGGKEIAVKLYSSKNQAVLSVINSGRPIPEDVKKRLFERFYRADEARTDEKGHYGLGLAIAKAIVNSHSGKIEINCFDDLIEFKVSLPKINM